MYLLLPPSKAPLESIGCYKDPRWAISWTLVFQRKSNRQILLCLTEPRPYIPKMPFVFTHLATSQYTAVSKNILYQFFNGAPHLEVKNESLQMLPLSTWADKVSKYTRNRFLREINGRNFSIKLKKASQMYHLPNQSTRSCRCTRITESILTRPSPIR